MKARRVNGEAEAPVAAAATPGVSVAGRSERIALAARRDRMLQVFLAQARGNALNADLLRSSIDRMVKIRAAEATATKPATMDDALITTLTAVSAALEAVGIDYAVTGSIASSVHCEPVASLDVGLIVLAQAQQAAGLAQRLTPRFYVSPETIIEAAETGGFANVIDNQTSLKVDLSFAGTDAFLNHVLHRRLRRTLGTGSPAFWFVTPEDIVLMKLLWRRETQSTKQWDNALSVAQVRGARMDWNYLFAQARALGLEDDLVRLRDEAGI